MPFAALHSFLTLRNMYNICPFLPLSFGLAQRPMSVCVLCSNSIHWDVWQPTLPPLSLSLSIICLISGFRQKAEIWPHSFLFCMVKSAVPMVEKRENPRGFSPKHSQKCTFAHVHRYKEITPHARTHTIGCRWWWIVAKKYYPALNCLEDRRHVAAADVAAGADVALAALVAVACRAS